MGCFTIHDEEGKHAHEGDWVRIYTRAAVPVLIAEGHYDTYGWVNDPHTPPMDTELDVFSSVMMIEDGLIPSTLIKNDLVKGYRLRFFENYDGNMPKIAKLLRFEGFTGLDAECQGCQSIFLDEYEDEV